MSDPIDLDDISQELADAATDFIGKGSDAWDEVSPEELCFTILKEAIRLGIVSPPCHYLDGPDGIVREMTYIKLYPGEPRKHPYYKHWKGEE